VIEGEDPVVTDKGEEVVDTGGVGGEGRGAGVDERPENTRGERFAGAGRTLEDEDGEGSRRAEGGEEPGEATEPGGAGRKVEAGAEGVERRRSAGIGQDGAWE
jgi:hypothetical protein